jgi:hypothetical protein
LSTQFINAVQSQTNITHTENGAVAYATTNSTMLDLFALGGALRDQEPTHMLQLFSRAFSEDALLATRCMFYFRDVRGGQGERDTFRKQLTWMAQYHPDIVRKNLQYIPYFGRWDDLYTLFGTSLEQDVIKLFSRQLAEDVGSEQPSLLAKWLKSENTSSKESRRLGRKTRVGLNVSPKAYRIMLSQIREKLNVIERLTSANEWDKINYESVPSQANLLYNNAFYKHDKDRRQQFLQKLKAGNVKINASTLFPYEIIRKAENVTEQNEAVLLDGLWKALPNYINDKQENAIAVVDVSGSMYGLPLHVAISVGIYLAERNTCEAYHNKFITFSNKPALVNIVGDDIVSKVVNMILTDWDMNTNMEAVFDLILDVAVRENLKQEEIPSKLYIISDMEFDQASSGNSDKTLFNNIAQKFTSAGYTMPNLVFWNVDARNTQFPMSMDDRGFQLVSGCSPSIFKYTMSGESLSAHELMLSVINDERYQIIEV